MTNEEQERRSIAAFSHSTTLELRKAMSTLRRLAYLRDDIYKEYDEIANEIDRRESLPMSKRVK